MTLFPQVVSGPRRLLTTSQNSMSALALHALSLLCALILLLSAPTAGAATTTYNLPAALTSSPFNCTLLFGTSYNCTNNINLGQDVVLNMTSDVTLNISASLTTNQKLTMVNNNHKMSMTIAGNVGFGQDTVLDTDMTVSGNLTFNQNVSFKGNIVATGTIGIGQDSDFVGNIQAGSTMTLNQKVNVQGNLTSSGDLGIGQDSYVTGNATSNSGSITLNQKVMLSGKITAKNGTIGIGQDSTITGDVESGGTLTLNQKTTITGAVTSGGNMSAGQDSTVNGDVTVTGKLTMNQKATINGDITTTDDMSMGQNSEVYGDVEVGDDLTVNQGGAIHGTCIVHGTSNYSCSAPVSSLHHLRITHGGSGVTCAPASVTINVCSTADNSGNCTASTVGISGTVYAKSSSGATLGSAAFSIAAGQSSQTVNLSVTTAATATFSVGGLSATPPNSTTCWNGSTTSCNYDYADSGFVFDIPNHRAAVGQTVTFKAVKKNPEVTNACVSTLPNGTYAVNFSCNYQNPASPTDKSVPLVISGQSSASLTCANASATATASPVSIAFANGAGSITTTYADAAKIQLSASYTGANTGTITGNDTFVAAPANFTINTTDTLKAGASFSATVKAVNSSGVVTPNFGQETNHHAATLTFSQCGGTNTGTFSGNLSGAGVANMPAFSNGVSTQTGLIFSEVSKLDATATMTTNTYTSTTGFQDPDSTLAVTGTTNTAGSGSCSGSFGKVGPYYLKTELEPTSNTKAFAYSGVAFTIKITAMNYNNQPTQNYATYTIGNTTTTYANNITLSAVDATGNAIPSATGTLLSTSVTSDKFIDGGYAKPSITFNFPTVTGGVNATKKAPTTIYLRATETSPGTATSAGSGTPEANVEMRFGRLRLFNAYSSSLYSVKMPVQAEYWNGSVWVVNDNDYVTKLTAGSIGFPTTPAPTVTGKYNGSGETLQAGKATITIDSNTTPKVKGYAYVTAHLGSLLGASNACPNNATNISGASLTGLRSYYGCDKSGLASGSYSYDPSARANFGIQSQETKGVVHVREVFN